MAATTARAAQSMCSQTAWTATPTARVTLATKMMTTMVFGMPKITYHTIQTAARTPTATAATTARVGTSRRAATGPIWTLMAYVIAATATPTAMGPMMQTTLGRFCLSAAPIVMRTAATTAALDTTALGTRVRTGMAMDYATLATTMTTTTACAMRSTPIPPTRCVVAIKTATFAMTAA